MDVFLLEDSAIDPSSPSAQQNIPHDITTLLKTVQTFDTVFASVGNHLNFPPTSFSNNRFLISKQKRDKNQNLVIHDSDWLQIGQSILMLAIVSYRSFIYLFQC